MMKISIKTMLASAMVALMAFTTACSSTEEAAKQKDESRVRQETAMRMWKNRCETKAGIKILRTIENVDGIFLIKLRPDDSLTYGDQFHMNDPYGRDSTDDRYIINFLKGYHHQPGDIKEINGAPPREGYKYVEAIDPRDGQRYRYTASMRVVGKKDASAPAIKAELAKNPNFDLNNRAFVLDRTPATGPLPRYGVTYDDISTHEEREYWIAGSSLRVIDLQTNETIAERIGYMVDWAQGSRTGNRAPWLLAADNACPDFHWPAPFNKPSHHGANLQVGQTLIFTEKTLKPSK